MKYHDVALCIPIPRFFRSLISKMASKWNFVNLRTHVGGGGGGGCGQGNCSFVHIV